MTEADALTKFCCGPPANTKRMCQGAQCLGWRWLKPAGKTDHDYVNGFCGLAGKP